MSHPFDATLKEIFSPAAADFQQAFNLSPIQPAQPLNVDLSTISAATDVAIGFGDPLEEIADLNFQSGPDAQVAARMLLYNAALHFRFAVPVQSILILLRPKAAAPGLNGRLTYISRGKRVTFEYEVIRLWQQPVEPFLVGGLGLLPLAPLCRMPRGRPLTEAIRNVVHEIDQRLAQLPDQAQAVRLMTAAFILTGMRVRSESLSDIFAGVKIMHQTTAYDTYVEEGIQKGKILRSHEMLLTMGAERLGVPGARTKAALIAIEDLDRLDRMGRALFTVKSWKALLAVE